MHSFALFSKSLSKSWYQNVVDHHGSMGLKVLNRKVQKTGEQPLENSLKLQLFGRFSLVEQLDEGYQISRIKHNEEVIKSQPILSTIIKCVNLAEPLNQLWVAMRRVIILDILWFGGLCCLTGCVKIQVQTICSVYRYCVF